MRPITFYATPDATHAFDDLAARWNMSSSRAVLSLTTLGIDIVEGLQAARGWVLPRWADALPDPGPRFRYFDEAGRAAGVSPLPPGSRKFPVILDDDLAARMERAARRENAWRLAGMDDAKRPPSVSLHGIMGWSTYEALVLAGHPLFPATKPHQMRFVQLLGEQPGHNRACRGVEGTSRAPSLKAPTIHLG